jgi:hypothetical protein
MVCHPSIFPTGSPTTPKASGSRWVGWVTGEAVHRLVSMVLPQAAMLKIFPLVSHQEPRRPLTDTFETQFLVLRRALTPPQQSASCGVRCSGLLLRPLRPVRSARSATASGGADYHGDHRRIAPPHGGLHHESAIVSRRLSLTSSAPHLLVSGSRWGGSTSPVWHHGRRPGLVPEAATGRRSTS